MKAKKMIPKKAKGYGIAENSLDTVAKKASVKTNEIFYSEGESFTLSLDDLSPFDDNPRIAKNSAYDSLYLSIEVNGFDSKVAVTKRPDSDKYMLSAGGNTRYSIMKALFEKTGNEKYNVIPVFFTKYVSEEKVYLDHLAENDNRGDYVFIDRAEGTRKIQLILEKELGKPLSPRELSKALVDKGYDGAKKSGINDMTYAVESLLPVIPTLLRTHQKNKHINPGMGSRLIAELRKYYNISLDRYLNASLENKKEDWHKIYYKTLSTFDNDVFLDMDKFKKSVIKNYGGGDKDREADLADSFEKKKPKEVVEITKIEEVDLSGKELSTDDVNTPTLNESLIVETAEKELPVKEKNAQSVSEPVDEVRQKRRLIHESAVVLAVRTEISTLITKCDNGIGYKLETFNSGLSSHDLSVWWILFSLAKIEDAPDDAKGDYPAYFNMLEEHKKPSEEFWSTFSVGQLTPDLMANALSILIDCSERDELYALQKIERELFDLLALTNGNIWND